MADSWTVKSHTSRLLIVLLQSTLLLIGGQMGGSNLASDIIVGLVGASLNGIKEQKIDGEGFVIAWCRISSSGSLVDSPVSSMQIA